MLSTHHEYLQQISRLLASKQVGLGAALPPNDARWAKRLTKQARALVSGRLEAFVAEAQDVAPLDAERVEVIQGHFDNQVRRLVTVSERLGRVGLLTPLSKMKPADREAILVSLFDEFLHVSAGLSGSVDPRTWTAGSLRMSPVLFYGADTVARLRTDFPDVRPQHFKQMLLSNVRDPRAGLALYSDRVRTFSEKFPDVEASTIKEIVFSSRKDPETVLVNYQSSIEELVKRYPEAPRWVVRRIASRSGARSEELINKFLAGRDALVAAFPDLPKAFLTRAYMNHPKTATASVLRILAKVEKLLPENPDFTKAEILVTATMHSEPGQHLASVRREIASARDAVPEIPEAFVRSLALRLKAPITPTVVRIKEQVDEFSVEFPDFSRFFLLHATVWHTDARTHIEQMQEHLDSFSDNHQDIPRSALISVMGRNMKDPVAAIADFRESIDHLEGTFPDVPTNLLIKANIAHGNDCEAVVLDRVEKANKVSSVEAVSFSQAISMVFRSKGETETRVEALLQGMKTPPSFSSKPADGLGDSGASSEYATWSGPVPQIAFQFGI